VSFAVVEVEEEKGVVPVSKRTRSETWEAPLPPLSPK